MKGNKLIVPAAFSCLLLTMVMNSFMTAYAQPVPKDEPIVLKLVTFQPPNLEKTKLQLQFVEKVNERAKGKLIIKYLGATEIVQTKELPMAIRNGIVDMGMLPATYYQGLVPPGDVWLLSRLTPQEERRPGGFFDYSFELHKKAGFFLLGRANLLEKGWSYYAIFTTNKAIKKPKDLEGRKISTGVMGIPFIKALGAAALNIEKSEMYTAAQTGVIDGYINPIDQMIGTGLEKVTKYMIDHTFGGAAQLTIINQKKWDSIPKNLQALIKEIQLEMEPIWAKQGTDIMRRDKQKLLAAGMVPTTFSSEDAKLYVNQFYDSLWKENIKRYPKEATKTKEILTKALGTTP